MRIHDNEALFNAANSKLPVIGIYVFDDTEFRKTGFGFDSMASHRLNFILETLEDLKKNLDDILAASFWGSLASLTQGFPPKNRYIFLGPTTLV